MADSDDFTRQLLENALKRYGEVQTPPGLEDRVIAGVMARRARSRRRTFWWRTVAAAAAVVMAAALASLLNPEGSEKTRQWEGASPNDLLVWVRSLPASSASGASALTPGLETSVRPSLQGTRSESTEGTSLTEPTLVPALNLRSGVAEEASATSLVGSLIVEDIQLTGLGAVSPE